MSGGITLILWLGGGISVLLMVFGIIATMREQRSLVDERLGRYVEETAAVSPEEAATPLTDWLNVRVEKSNLGEKIARDLARADLKLKPGEYVALLIIASFGTAVVGWYFGGQNIWFAMAGVIAGPFLPRFYVKRQQKQRLVRFNDQLPDMLNLIVNGLRAGYSNMQALEAVSKELPSPLSTEFRRVVREMQIGISIEQALDNLLRRIPSDDLDLIITAMNIQREVGGNLAEILEIISYTIRERIRIKREIQVLVSQVLYSGRILAMMPIALAFFLWGANRSYMEQFILPENRLCGIPMLICGALMIVAGYYAMTRVADIQI